jgi:hypothetical protein
MIQAALRKARQFFIGSGCAKRREPEAFALAAALGPLEWLPTTEAWYLLRHLFGLTPQHTQIDTLSFRFWPPRENGCEPDLIIDCYKEQVLNLRIIVEAKWYTKIYGSQLAIQWKNFALPILSRSKCLHVILGADPTSITEARDHAFETITSTLGAKAGDAWQIAVKEVQWRDLIEKLSDLPSELRRSGLLNLASQIRQLLELQGAKAFNGFSDIAALDISLLLVPSQTWSFDTTM